MPPPPPPPVPAGQPIPLTADAFELVAPGTMPDFTCPACMIPYGNIPQCPSCNRCPFCCGCRLCTGCDVAISGTASCRSCMRCNGCCHCRECVRCHRNRGDFCLGCGGCVTNCCHCFTCELCRRVLPGSTPRQGSTCVDCNPRGFFFFQVMTPTFHTALLPAQHRRNPSPRCLSGEIEISFYNTTHSYNPNVARAVSKWGGQIVHDGSVRGGEINTAPAGGDKWLEQIADICAALQEDGAQIDPSAGGHLHIDVRDFSFFDMRRLVFLYEKIEGPLYQLVNPGRRSNSYCAPVNEKYITRLLTGKIDKADKESIRKGNKLQLITNMYGKDMGRDIVDAKRNKNGMHRYLSLNIHSWLHRGSVECRMQQGSIDPEQWQGWGMLWASIVDFAMKRREKDIVALKKSEDLLMEIASTEKLRSWISWSRIRYNERSVI